MPVILNVDGPNGRCAIYTGDDDEPMTNPQAHVSRLRFHSDLFYPRVISTHEHSVTFPSRSSGDSFGTEIRVQHNLFAHGLAGTPYVEGKIISGLAQQVTLAGSVPVQSASQTTYIRAAHLGADATHVFIREIACVGGHMITVPNNFSNVSFGSITLGVRVYLTDVLL